MNNARLNHRAEVLKLAEIISNRQTQNKPMYAIDLNRWGISEPFSDCENSTIYRDSIFELANDTFIGEDEEMNEPHYENAQYESIHDY
jgi:hypothetical protein